MSAMLSELSSYLCRMCLVSIGSMVWWCMCQQLLSAVLSISAEQVAKTNRQHLCLLRAHAHLTSQLCVSRRRLHCSCHGCKVASLIICAGRASHQAGAACLTHCKLSCAKRLEPSQDCLSNSQSVLIAHKNIPTTRTFPSVRHA